MHIKFSYHGTIYGPLRAPSSLRILCRSIRVSLRAMPILERTPPAPPISNPDEPIAAGFYVLRADLAIKYDPLLDEAEPLRLLVPKAPERPSEEDDNKASSPIDSADPVQAVNSAKPMSREKLNAAVEAMIRILSSIPPRYFKYNARISCQLQMAGDRVFELQKDLDALLMGRNRELSISAPGSYSKTRNSEALDAEICLIQFSIIHTLKAAWDTVWLKYSPPARGFQVSDVSVTFGPAFDIFEVALDRVNQWQRITMDARAWNQVKKSSTFDHLVNPTKLLRYPGFKKNFLDLPELPSGRYPHAWEYLAQLPEQNRQSIDDQGQKARNPLEPLIQDLKKRFLTEWIRSGATSNAELEQLLESVLVDHEYKIRTYGIGYGSLGTVMGQSKQSKREKLPPPIPKALVPLRALARFTSTQESADSNVGSKSVSSSAESSFLSLSAHSSPKNISKDSESTRNKAKPISFHKNNPLYAAHKVQIEQRAAQQQAQEELETLFVQRRKAISSYIRAEFAF